MQSANASVASARLQQRRQAGGRLAASAAAARPRRLRSRAAGAVATAAAGEAAACGAGIPCHSSSSSSSSSTQPQQPCRCAVVIVDHGSRRAASNDMLVEFCALYQQLTQHPIVEPAHMEIAEPTVAQAVGRCVAAGATHVVVAPYFLSRGRHIQDDIPALVADARAQHPGVQFSVAAPIGIDPVMVQIIQSRVAAALAQDCPAAAAVAAADAATNGNGNGNGSGAAAVAAAADGGGVGSVRLAVAAAPSP